MRAERTYIQQGNDEADIRHLYKQLMEGWNQGDGEAFGAAFEEDGYLVGFDGTHFKGLEEIVPFHQKLFDTYLRGTRLIGRVTNVRFLSPDIALLHAVGGTVMRGKSRRSRERDSIQTLVAIRRGRQWRFAAFQNTRLRPMGSTSRNTFLWLFTDFLWKLFGAKNRSFPPLC